MATQAKNLKISVERLLEQEVDQISRSGEETYIKPFSLSEELAFFASKIDFHGTEEILQDDKSGCNGNITEEVGRNELSRESSKDESRWPWETVHAKLRIALSEICVMLDVLECLNRKKYLVLDPIQQNPEQNKQTVQMLQNRKYLARAGSIIAKGASALQKGNAESVAETPENDDEYYMELMQLRQYWRIKKTGFQITGDITYRSAGSQFWHPGSIEVKAALGQTSRGDDQRKLVVNISPDLMQHSRLTVEVIDHAFTRPWSARTNLSPWEKSKTAYAWENDLQFAQIHLFNLEVFSLLSNDAFQSVSYDAIEVLDSRICCRLLDDVQVSIVHHVGEKEGILEDSCPKESADDLTLLLSRLLLRHHAAYIKTPSLYPATSNHYNTLLKSSSIHNLLNRKVVAHQSSVLKDFIAEAKHKVWVTRLMYFLDERSTNLCGSSLVMHWNLIKYRCKSSVTLLILTKTQATTVKSTLLITIDSDGFSVTFEDAEKLCLPFNIDILCELLDLELKNHLLKIANSLCIQHGWFLVQTSHRYSVATGSHSESLENGSIYYSQKGRLFLRLYILSIDDIAVAMSLPVEDFSHLDDKFKWLNIRYKSLHWQNLPGRSIPEKIENLFLCH